MPAENENEMSPDLQRELMEAGVTPDDIGNDDVDLEYHGVKPRKVEPQTPATTSEIEARQAAWMKRIRALYDSFEQKDMPFEQFVKEMKDLTNPAKYNEDLQSLIARRETAASMKAKINAAIKVN